MKVTTAESLARVYISNFIKEEKLYIKYKSIKVDMPRQCCALQLIVNS